MSTEPRALILAGGSGTRFWPASRRRRPKQALSLDGDKSLLRRTFERLAPIVGSDNVWVSTTHGLAGLTASELPEVDSRRLLLEPVARNTAPAIAWSVAAMGAAGREARIGVFPADHLVADDRAFATALELAYGAVAESDRVMTLGVAPRRAVTGYGYLEASELLEPETGLRRVRRFVEKPDLETARRFLAAGNYFWNAGIFVFRGGRLLELLARHAPDIAAVLGELERRPEAAAEIYPRMPSISIDHAVMEKAEEMAMLPLDCGWSDVGSWGALAELLPADEHGNAGRGDFVAVDGGGNLLFAEAGTVAVLGVSDLIVVRTDDAVLVTTRRRSQEVKRLVEELESRGRDDLL